MTFSENDWVAELQKNISHSLFGKPGMQLTVQYVVNDESGNSELFFFELDGEKVNVAHGQSDLPDFTFSLNRSIARSINSGELTTEEAFLKGLLKFEGDAEKLIAISSEIS
ncbi:MAG: SCP2 sterol-binding domain-containing protein [Actinomycetota bacterium]